MSTPTVTTMQDLIAEVFEDSEVGSQDDRELVASDLAKAENMATHIRPAQGIKFLMKRSKNKASKPYYTLGIEVLKTINGEQK